MLAGLGRQGLRCLGYLGLDQPRQGLAAGEGPSGVVEAVQQALAFRVADQRDGGQRLPVIVHHGLQQRFEVAGKALHAGLVEQRGGVLQAADQRLALLAHVQRQVELGHLDALRHRFQLQPLQLQDGAIGGQPVEGGLEQWRVAEAACRADDLHHLLERQVLVRLGLEQALLHPGQQGFGGRRARQVDAYRQGVDEQPDQRLQLGSATPGHRATHHHFGLAGQARQGRGPGTHQHRVQGHLVTLRQGAQAHRQRLVQPQHQAGAAEVLARRARPITG